MSITTDPAVSKKERADQMKEFHKETFASLGLTDPFFLPKLCYRETKTPNAPQENIVSFFASEMAKGVDIYIEYADFENKLQYPNATRSLFKWRYNSNYAQEYVHTQEEKPRYFVPVAELIRVKEYLPEEEKKTTPTANCLTPDEQKFRLDGKEDLPLKEATLRDLAAIMWRRPISDKKWINDLINE